MTGAHQNAQQMRQLLTQLDDIVTVGFEELEKRAQMRGGQRGAAAMVWWIAVHEIVHASA